MYDEISRKWGDVTKKHLRTLHNARCLCSVSFQPFPSVIGKRSQEAGGNAMGLSAPDPDRLILELQGMWANNNDDETVRNMAKDMTAWLEGMRPKWMAEAGADKYMPYFMNDAAEDQNVTESYRDYEKLKALLQMQVDPDGNLKRRLGGFKY